ncbi:MAG: hypothetical protein ACREO0_15595 [Pseudoxanthomonas sp.]
MDADTLLKKTRERLRRHEGQYAEIARQFPEIGYSWLTKVAHGQITNPKVSSLQQLIEALDAFEKASGQTPVSEIPADPGNVDPDAGRIEPVETP